ncbi:MAG: orotidine 5'-phosphate decarboxylase [Peltula sp. TS41687]|nr:MAG: orotidine 5'-phosphate decarboxylase [Peltula sp. TS41687]
MATKSRLSHAHRAEAHTNPLVKKLFRIAETKKTNVIVSADLTRMKELLALVEPWSLYRRLQNSYRHGPGFWRRDGQGKSISEKHNFLIFEDRKFIDIGNTVRMQYHGGALRISEWAHIVNASVLAGEGTVEALSQTAGSKYFAYTGDRALLILAGWPPKAHWPPENIPRLPWRLLGGTRLRDFVIFSTGINRFSKGDSLGQQYQTPAGAVARGADFIISERGIYTAEGPVKTVQLYQKEGWEAYLERIKVLTALGYTFE